jgi:hypothetical protein
MMILNWFKKNYNAKFIYLQIRFQQHNILLYENKFAFLSSAEQNVDTISKL